MSKKIICITLVLVMALAFCGGCKEQGKSGAAKDGSGKSFGISVMNLNNTFFADLVDGIEENLNDSDELIVMDGQMDINKQVNDIEDLIQQKVDTIFVVAIDWKGIKPALESAERAGIPVIAVDAPVYDTDLVVSTVASDNVLAGKQCAKAIAEKLGEKGNVALVTYSLSKSARDRSDGFLEEIKNYKDIKIVAQQDPAGTIEDALPLMESILQSNPEVEAVFAINDPAAIGCIAAIESAGKLDDIIVVGVDGSKEGKELIESGKLYGTAEQFPGEVGKTAVEVAYKHLKGEEVEKDTKVPVKFITKEDLD